ncbi:MAG: helix-turn-helix domain-containing protein [Roseburia inulinivorans]
MERPRFDIVASGERMREIRRQRNISVKQVMEYMGFESTQAVYKWEAGKCYPQADNLVALAILYNVSPMELLVEEDRVSSSSCLWGEFICGIANQQLLDEKILPVYDSKKGG